MMYIPLKWSTSNSLWAKAILPGHSATCSATTGTECGLSHLYHFFDSTDEEEFKLCVISTSLRTVQADFVVFWTTCFCPVDHSLLSQGAEETQT